MNQTQLTDRETEQIDPKAGAITCDRPTWPTRSPGNPGIVEQRRFDRRDAGLRTTPRAPNIGIRISAFATAIRLPTSRSNTGHVPDESAGHSFGLNDPAL